MTLYGCEPCAWHFHTMRPVVVLFAEQRTQGLSAVLRIAIHPTTTFHKTGGRGLDTCRAPDVLVDDCKVALPLS